MKCSSRMDNLDPKTNDDNPALDAAFLAGMKPSSRALRNRKCLRSVAGVPISDRIHRREVETRVRTISKLIMLSILAILGVMSPATAKTGTSEWSVETTDSCHLYRTKQGRFVFIAATSPREWILRIHDRKWRIRADQTPLFKVELAGKPQIAAGKAVKTSDGWDGLIARVEPELVYAAADSGKVGIEVNQIPFADVSLDGLKQAIEVLQPCAEKLPPPLPVELRVANSAKLISDLSFRAGEVGTGALRGKAFVFRLDVDKEGNASRCTVVQSSGSPAVDERACSLLQQRARFRPATNSAGAPVPTSFQSRVVFQLP